MLVMADMNVGGDQELFEQGLQDLGLQINANQSAQLQKFKMLLAEWGKVHNLTTVENSEFYQRHVLNSLGLTRLSAWSGQGTLIDIGSGAGFPGIALKIFFPELHLTLVEAVEKKTHFLEAVTYELGLKNVSVCSARAEELGHKKEYREQFDFVTSRALAHLQIAAELCIPFIRVGGLFLAFKGQKAEEELEQSQSMMRELACSSEEILSYQGDSRIIVIRKNAVTATQYPRGSAVIRRAQKQLLENIK